MTQIETTRPIMSASPSTQEIRNARQALETFFRDDWEPLHALIRSLESAAVIPAADAITDTEPSELQGSDVIPNSCASTPGPTPTTDHPEVAASADERPVDRERLARLAKVIERRISTTGVAG